MFLAAWTYFLAAALLLVGALNVFVGVRPDSQLGALAYWWWTITANREGKDPWKTGFGWMLRVSSVFFGTLLAGFSLLIVLGVIPQP